MDLLTIISPILEIGLIPVLLILFVRFFFEKDKERENQLGDLSASFEKREALLHADTVRREDQYKEREKILTAESARREEILKKESEKREKIIREEAEKRENALLTTIDSFSRTMKEISLTMSEIKNTTTQMQYKIDIMGDALEQHVPRRDADAPKARHSPEANVLMCKGGVNDGQTA